MLYDVFVSHASLDKANYVDKLVSEMKSLGIKVFYDDDSIAWGDNIKEKVDEGLNNCRIAILIISKHYIGIMDRV